MAVFIHPKAICESDCVGEGTRVWAFAHVMEGAVIGRDCNICDHAFIESGARVGNGVIVKNQALIWDGVTIEDAVFIGPGATFTNDLYPRSRHLEEAAGKHEASQRWLKKTLVRRGATIGARAVIVCGHTIGAYATVGAGAIVTREVAAHRLVVGQPAREVGWVCRCGTPLDARLACRDCPLRYEMRDGAIELLYASERTATSCR